MLAPTAISWSLLLACGDRDSPDSGMEDSGMEDSGLEDSGLPFEEVLSYRNSSTKYCGPGVAKESYCNGDGLTVVYTSDAEEFAALFEAHIKSEAPEVDLDGKTALLSYLPRCPSLDIRLDVDKVTLDGETLHLYESLFIPATYSEAIACPFNVITMADSITFTEVQTTLVGGSPW